VAKSPWQLTKVEYVSDKILCIVLDTHWCDNIVLNGMSQLRTKVTSQMRDYVRELGWYSISSLSIV
jgi:hypothetical protein